MRRLLVLGLLLAATCAQAGALEDSGVKGGVIVVIGCEDTTLIGNLGQSERFLVQALDGDMERVENARKAIAKRGAYGRVSVAVFRGNHLPYADNLVNLLIDASGKGGVAEDEVLRVLAPRGVAMIGGKRLVKPKPIRRMPCRVEEKEKAKAGRRVKAGKKGRDGNPCL